MRSNLVDLPVRLVHETDQAYLVTIDGEKNVWVPKSISEFEENRQHVGRARNGTLTLPENIAIEKELV